MFACAGLVLALAPVMASDLPGVEQIVAKLEQADRQRQQALTGYTGFREYRVENARFKVRAHMKVEVRVSRDGAKEFRILEQSGPGAIRKMVFQRMIDTEAKASSTEALRAATRFSAENYQFRLVDTEVRGGRLHYVLEVEPRSAHPLLFRGRLWVDSEQHAIARLEGAPAQKPSFWVQRTKFVHEYQPMGSLWLAVSNRSESDIRVFGKSVTHIAYTDYRMTER
jgi:hypothetical protein